MKYTDEMLEDILATVQTEGWDLIMRHIEEVIEAEKDLLVESDDKEDEVIKGGIRALKRNVLTLKSEFMAKKEEPAKKSK